MKADFRYQVGDEVRTVTVARDGESYLVTVGENRYRLRARRPEHGRLNMHVLESPDQSDSGTRRLRAYVAQDGQCRFVAMAGQTWVLEKPRPRQARRGPGTGGAGSLEAGMPALVLDVLVAEGDQVEKGDALVLLEAMKMELRITAPQSGRISQVFCQAGEMVDRGQLLVAIE